MMDTSLALPAAGRVTRALVGVVIGLVLLSVAGQMSKYGLGHPKLQGFVPAFYVDYESNVPTWYSSFALGLAAGLLAVIALVKKMRREAYAWHWAALAALFLLLSIDEVAMFHEYPIAPLREAWGASGLLYYTWVVPAMIVVAALAVSFQRFLWRLPRRTGGLFVLAAVVFVGGAIGVEMLSGAQASAAGEENFAYSLIITAEELCEMLGVVIFIHALVDYIHGMLGGLQISVGRRLAH